MTCRARKCRWTNSLPRSAPSRLGRSVSRRHSPAGLVPPAGVGRTGPGHQVAARDLPLAQRLVHQVAQVLAPDCVPLFLTDGFKEYLRAVLTHYGHWVQPPRCWATGRLPKPRWMPLPQLQYAQVIKQTRRRRLVAVSSHVVFGTLAGLSRCWPRMAGGYIRRSLRGPTSRSAILWPAWGGGCGRPPNTKPACATNSPSIRSITIFACPMPLYGCPYHNPNQRKGRAQQNGRASRSWISRNVDEEG